MSSAALPPSTSNSSTSAAATDSRGEAPWLWRLLTTPVSEVVAGRVTGWMKPERAVEEAALPAPLAAVVLDVAKRTHLWRSEQTEIARELAAHFADGLEAGRSVEQLIANFGDASQAARLLRRAAKRNRPWPWRAMRFTIRAAVFSFLALILIYGGMAVRFYLGRPGPIIDYRPELNAAAAAVKDEDRAWPAYREALLRLPRPHVEDIVLGQERFNRMPHPGEKGWDAVETYLRDAAPALESARQAVGKRGMGLVVGYTLPPEDQQLWPEAQYGGAPDITSPESNGMMGILLPHLTSLRKLAMMLSWDAEAAASAGDGQRAIADLRAMLALARHLRETPLIINDLVGISVFSRASTALDGILAHQPELWTDDGLILLAHELAAFDDRAMAIDLAGERTGFKDVLQRIYTDDGAGDGRMSAQGVRWLRDASNLWLPAEHEYDTLLAIGGPALSAVILGRRDMAEAYERLASMMDAEMSTPLWEREESQVDRQLEEWMASPIDRLRYFPLVTLMPAISKASINAELAMQRRDATITAIALELWRREHGDWPATLAELVPSMMPALPVDRFDGQSLRYRVVEGRPLLYSVGTDREDDGGVLPPTATANSRQWYAQRWVPRSVLQQNITTGRPDGTRAPVYDGDWLLWPPLPEEPLRQEEPPSTASHWNGAP